MMVGILLTPPSRVCGIHAYGCCLAAGFMLFDASLHPTLHKWLTVGSSLDWSATLGAQLWAPRVSSKALTIPERPTESSRALVHRPRSCLMSTQNSDSRRMEDAFVAL